MDTVGMLVFLAVLVGGFAWLHFKARRIAAVHVVKQIGRQFAPSLYRSRLIRAFLHNTRPWLSIFMKHPVGWGQGSRKRLQRVIADANRHVQTLNDHFTDPSGKLVAAPPGMAAPLSVVGTEAAGHAQADTERRGTAQG
jgi:hypothetical protein